MSNISLTKTDRPINCHGIKEKRDAQRLGNSTEIFQFYSLPEGFTHSHSQAAA